MVHVDHLKGTGCKPSLGSGAGGGESSLMEELVESQVEEKDSLVYTESLSSEFSTPSCESSAVQRGTASAHGDTGISIGRYSAGNEHPRVPL